MKKRASLEEETAASSPDLSEEELDEDDEESSDTNAAESLEAMHRYLRDPLKAFMSNPTVTLTPELTRALYAARAVVAQQIDPTLKPSGPFADRYRALELERLATMQKQLFEPRRAKAREEATSLSAEQLAKEGTGLLWSAVLHSLVEGLLEASHGSVPSTFTERDEEIFNHCIDIEPSYVDTDPFRGVQFTFHFVSNPFFSNTQIRCAFHYAAPALSLTRFGVDVPFISAVTSDTPIQWKSEQRFEQLSDEDIDQRDVNLRSVLIAGFLGSAVDASAVKDIEKLVCLWPRPLFTMLFDTNTSAAAKALLEERLLCTVAPCGTVVRDEAPDGSAAIKASAFEMRAWVDLARGLDAVARAPLIHALDEDNSIVGEEGEEEEDEEEESDDESEDEHRDKKPHRAEKPKTADPPECKQQ